MGNKNSAALFWLFVGVMALNGLLTGISFYYLQTTALSFLYCFCISLAGIVAGSVASIVLKKKCDGLLILVTSWFIAYHLGAVASLALIVGWPDMIYLPLFLFEWVPISVGFSLFFYLILPLR